MSSNLEKPPMPYPYHTAPLTRNSSIFLPIDKTIEDEDIIYSLYQWLNITIPTSDINLDKTPQTDLVTNKEDSTSTKVDVINLQQDFYTKFYQDQLYQIIQHLFYDAPLSNQSNNEDGNNFEDIDYDKKWPSLNNYVKSILNYQKGPPILLGAPDYQESMTEVQVLNDLSNIPPEYYGTVLPCSTSITESDLGPDPTQEQGCDYNTVANQLLLLLTFAIATKNPILVTWLLDPQFDDDHTWEERIIDADTVIHWFELEDSDILADFFVLSFFNRLANSSKRILYKLFFSQSPRHRGVITAYINNTQHREFLGDIGCGEQ